MANDMNQCNFTGRLGADPETRYTTGGTAVVNIRIAVGGRRKNGEEWEDTTEWVPLVMFGRQAEVACEYLRKGSQIRVTGRFQTRQWDQDGVTRYTSEIFVQEMQMLGSKSDNQGGAPRQQAGKPAQAPQTDAAGGAGFDDDIPFAPYQRNTVI